MSNQPDADDFFRHQVIKDEIEPRYWVESSKVDAEGMETPIGKAGPFPSFIAATVCSEIAYHAGVEVIGDEILQEARRVYMEREVSTDPMGLEATLNSLD